MIRVCDSIMGSGKTSAAINYMNDNDNKKYIYITPYLEEVERIKCACNKLNFREPSNKIGEYHFKKTEHAAQLIKQGKNIVTTHQAFKLYTNEMLEDIRANEYTLFIDENVDVIERYDIDQTDLDIFVNSGYATYEDGAYKLSGKEYDGAVFSTLYNFLQTRDLDKMELTSRDDSNTKQSAFYWVFSEDFLTAFKDVIIMTYLFEAYNLHHYMVSKCMYFEYIGVKKSEDNRYFFSKYPGDTPEYVKEIKNKVHVLEHEKLNAIGEKQSALSVSWFENNPSSIDRIKLNVSNFYKNICPPGSGGKRLWSTYTQFKSGIQGKGYTNSFAVFNEKATNRFKDRKYLAYLVNVYMNPYEFAMYKKMGVVVDVDIYALSIMVQWIWRSAIRDGEEIFIYLPSLRMRNILYSWMNDISEIGNRVKEVEEGRCHI